MPFTIRPLTVPDDYPVLAALRTAVQPEAVTVAMLREQDTKIPSPPREAQFDEAGRLTAFTRHRVLAVDEAGKALGFGSVWRAPWTAPGLVFIDVLVDPGCRGRGVGSALLAYAEGYARARGAQNLKGDVRENSPESAAFIHARGYATERHLFESTLDVAAFNREGFAGVVEAVKAGGIGFFTLADRWDDAVERQLYELDLRTFPDIPGNTDQPWEFTEWRKWTLESEQLRPDCVIMAADGDRIVGVTTMKLMPESGAMYTGYTGVDRAYRGRKVALALKLLAVEAARRHGAPYMRTNNDSQNAPMLAVNRKMGYVPAPGVYIVHKRFQ